MKPGTTRGFTLIELSIVLIIVGLAIGGVLMGRDLIQAGRVRSQIAQIQSYQAAVHVFESKYLSLPGDIPGRLAQRFGFTARGPNPGEGDGNGIIEGYNFQANTSQGTNQMGGETVLFWMDLTYANGLNVNLIEGSFNPPNPLGNGWVHYANEAPLFFPAAKLGRGNYVSVWSINRNNYFAICVVPGWGDGGFGLDPYYLDQQPVLGITVNEAYAIDSKIDDGLPQSGGVQAMAPVAALGAWANIGMGPWGWMLPPGVATTGTAATCYDNNNVSGATEHYSVAQNNGSGVNCTLSIQIQ